MELLDIAIFMELLDIVQICEAIFIELLDIANLQGNIH
jgi:hypothetical protein